MKMIISGKNIDVTPGLRSAVEAKLGKLERYFTADTEIYVTLSVEKDRQKIEVTIPMKGNIIRSEQTSSDMSVSYTHLRAHETDSYLVCRLLLEKKKKTDTYSHKIS